MPDALTPTNLRRARMVSMLLGAPESRTPLEVARWFGAMQAQDVASGHWSLGLRCPATTEADVLAAFERADLVRTWPMRGTIHVVPAVDVRWLLDLTGVRALSGAARRREMLGLTLRDVDTAAAALDTALADQVLLTRAQALAVIGAAGVDVTGQRGYHVLWYCAQVGVTCIGPQRGPDQTFARIDDWAPQQRSLTRDEALAELLFRYVRGHGPVSPREFASWSGLPLGDARTATRANAGRIVPVGAPAQDLWATADLADLVRAAELDARPAVALPGFDELLLGYRDRSAHVPDGAMEQVVPGGNGMFRATVVLDGTVAATWTRTQRARRLDVDLQPLRPLTQAELKDVESAFARYAAFLGRDVAVRATG